MSDKKSFICSKGSYLASAIFDNLKTAVAGMTIFVGFKGLLYNRRFDRQMSQRGGRCRCGPPRA